AGRNTWGAVAVGMIWKTPSKAFVTTPMMVCAVLFMKMVRPTMFGSAAKYCLHAVSLSIATFGAPRYSSSVPLFRPIAGWSPTALNKLALVIVGCMMSMGIVWAP